MLPVLNALAPIFLIIALGYGLKQKVLPEETAWALADKLNYFVLFPALLIFTLASADLGAVPIGRLFYALVGAVFSAMALVFALRPAFAIPWASFTSVFQGAVRWNGFIALAVVSNLLGPEGVTVLAVIIGILIPFINVVSILVLSGNHAGGPNPIRRVARAVATNPLILACAAGLALNQFPGALANPLGTTLDLLSRASLPLGLLCVGAGLVFQEIRNRPTIIAATLSIKLVALPLLFALWCGWLGVDGIARQSAILAGSVPIAVSAYPLARQLGGDAPLMATLITLSVLGSMVTMPLVVWLTT